MAGLFDDCCTRELVLREGITVSVAEQHSGLDGEPGGVVWDSALVLAHYLATATDRGRIRLGAARVLELGAGTGCAGLAAAALGAAEVVLTDRPQLLPLLQHNIEVRTRLCWPLLCYCGSLFYSYSCPRRVLLRHPRLCLALCISYTAEQTWGRS